MALGESWLSKLCLWGCFLHLKLQPLCRPPIPPIVHISLTLFPPVIHKSGDLPSILKISVVSTADQLVTMISFGCQPHISPICPQSNNYACVIYISLQSFSITRLAGGNAAKLCVCFSDRLAAPTVYDIGARCAVGARKSILEGCDWRPRAR